MTTPAAATAAAVSGPAVRLVLQRVNSAALLVDNVSRRVNIQRGVVCHCAFFDGANESHIQKAIKIISECKIFAFDLPQLPKREESAEEEGNNEKKATAPAARPKPVSLEDDDSLSLMIVPQASIAGRVKGKNAQYHSQCKKDTANELYQLFIDGLRKALLPNEFTKTEGVLDLNGELVETKDDSDSDHEDMDDRISNKKNKKVPTWLKRKVLNGTYGNTQALSFDSPGPMTHVLDVEL